MFWNRRLVPRLVPQSFSGVGSSWAAKSEVGGWGGTDNLRFDSFWKKNAPA